MSGWGNKLINPQITVAGSKGNVSRVLLFLTEGELDSYTHYLADISIVPLFARSKPLFYVAKHKLCFSQGIQQG